jgi:sarcosine oxidase gamma subunit
LPDEFTVIGPYPNPFNPWTTLRFALPEAAQVNLTLYDVAGRQVQILIEGWRTAGYHEVAFDAEDLSSGVYFYRLQADKWLRIGKLVLLK